MEVNGLIKRRKQHEQKTFTLNSTQRAMALELERMLEELLAHRA